MPRWRRKASLLAVACALVAPGAVAPAVGAPASEVLLFTSQGVLQTLHLDGSAERKSLGRVGEWAVMSPDGRHVAGVTDAGVRVIRVDTAALVAFVPSGNSVAFAGNRHVAVGYTDTNEGHECDTEGALYVVDLAAPVPRPVTVAGTPLIVLAASPGSAIVSVPVSDCSDNDVERVALDSGARTPLPGLLDAYSLDPVTGDGWYHERRSRGFPRGRGVVLSGTNKVLGRTNYINDAAYGPASAVVYSEPVRAREGGVFVTRDVILRLGKGIPRPGDRRTHFNNDGNLVWSTTGTAFALRREHRTEGWEACICTTRDLRCRPVPLRWRDQVDLLGIIPATHLG